MGPNSFAIFANTVSAFYIKFCTFLGILKRALSADSRFERKLSKKFLRVPRARCLYASEYCEHARALCASEKEEKEG